MALEVIALATNRAKLALYELFKFGKSFKVSYFSVGAQGHDPLDVTLALSPDPALEDCLDPIFGPKLIPPENVSVVSVFCPNFLCILAEEEANGPLSHLCLIAEIVFDPDLGGPPDPPEYFLFAVANFPLKVKTDNDRFEFNVIIP